MSAVFIVTSGEYSEYGIRAVFDNKEQAETFVRLRASDAEVEEWELNPEYIDYAALGYYWFDVYMLKNGTVHSVEEIKDELLFMEEREFSLLNHAHVLAATYSRDSQGYKMDEVGERLWIRLIAKGEAQAVKVANEKRIQLLAENRWKPGETA